MTEATKKTFKKTLNLPQTSFAMRANLVQNEPQSLKRWTKMKLYEQLRQRKHPKGPYVFHDGPPYANGSIHLGHLLNKVLKDFVVRTRSMEGYDVPYIPGWDCHGLPIEHKVMQERMAERRDQGTKPPSDQGAKADSSQSEIPNPKSEIMDVRRACKKYASKYIKLQGQQMQRLLTMADYDNPYLTMVPAYEAAVLEVFADLVSKGLVYRMKKPVHWSIDNQTALAEAELEYEDREDTSVFVLFDLADASRLKLSDLITAQLPGAPVSLMIWTTTPWTLPANLAVAVHEKFEYGLYRVRTGEGANAHDYTAIIACELAAKVISAAGGEPSEPLAVLSGRDLVGLKYRHPFLKDHADRSVVAADYVTLEDGTGLVHTAPGHGVEDYQTGLREGLDIYCPVQADGTFNDTAPDWLQGLSVWKGNDIVVEKLREAGNLFHANRFMHSYPHDWRSKGPVIFRATEQWFVDVNKKFEMSDTASVKQRALDATETDVKFFPEWGRNRMRGMLETRPDWCLSRQRSWGLPIPAFFGPEDGQVLLTRASVQAVADLIREKGSDVWFVADAKDLLANYDAEADPDAPDWIASTLKSQASSLRKAADIFDVWFESGSSWNAVIRQRGLARPDDAPAVTDLYLEGSDQHRGWFQLSLLPALGVLGKPPFESVLTHGFMVDKEGKKISKSDHEQAKRIPSLDEIFKDFGADISRWWVSGLNTDNDIKVDKDYFQHAGEEYRKVRNTLRFLLSNLGDFDMGKDRQRFEDEDAGSVDAWITGELIKLSDKVRAAYDKFEFRKAHIALFDFCNDTLSAVYLTAVKDRLYCDAPTSPRRRRSQSTMYRIATTLIRLLAPIMPHTADEAWQALEGEDAPCVHLKEYQDVDCMRQIPVNEHWPKVMEQRDGWLKSLEDFRQANDLDNPLDCGLRVPQNSDVDLSAFNPTDLADLCGISRFELTDGNAQDTLEVLDLRNEPRCDRSWKRDGSVKERTHEGESCLLSDRDAEALNL